MAGDDVKVELVRKLDRVYAVFDGDPEEVPVRLVWARPISGRGGEVALVGDDKGERLMLPSLDVLDPDSRAVAEAELGRRYFMPAITRVVRTTAASGNRYWDVETDRGPQRFLMKDPNKSIIHVTQDRLIIRDALGNRYAIESLSALDPHSRSEVQKVI
jgi:hypothetical protein